MFLHCSSEALSLADGTLSLLLQRGEHDDDGVVPWRGSDQPPELLPVQPDHCTLAGPLHHLTDLL